MKSFLGDRLESLRSACMLLKDILATKLNATAASSKWFASPMIRYCIIGSNEIFAHGSSDRIIASISCWCVAPTDFCNRCLVCATFSVKHDKKCCTVGLVVCLFFEHLVYSLTWRYAGFLCRDSAMKDCRGSYSSAFVLIRANAKQTASAHVIITYVFEFCSN